MRGSGILVTLAVALATAGALAALTAPAQDRLREGADRVEALRAEAHALAGRIRTIEQAAVADAPTTEIARGAATAAAAALDLQDRAVGLARESGLEPSTFGSHPAPSDLTLPAVGAVIEGEGEIADLARFLAALEAARPPVAVGQMALRDLSQRRAEGGVAPVGFRVAVWSFWSEEGSR